MSLVMHSQTQSLPPLVSLRVGKLLSKAKTQRQKLVNNEPRLSFRGPQFDLLRSSEPEIVLSGPAGTGKSVACLYKMHHAALKYPNSRYLILRKTRASLTDSGLVTFEQRILGGDDHPICAGARRENRHSYKYANGSEIVVGGMDNPTRLFSSEYDRIYVQECTELSLGEWESLLRSMRNNKTPYHQIIGDCNPDAPGHWLYRRAHDSNMARMWHTLHENNPNMHDGTDWTEFGKRYLATLDRLTGVRRDRLRFGRWVSAEGAVYDGWSPAIHLIDRFNIPASWPRYRAIDFGYGNPFVCLWLAVDPDGRIYVYREIYRTKRLVEDHAVNIIKLSAGERIEMTICDHDAEDRATLTRHGISNVGAIKAISSGIQAVQARLPVVGEKPRLMWLRDSLVDMDMDLEAEKKTTSGVQEIDAYMWPKGQDGKAVKEIPLDTNNHAMDALRYGVVMIDKITGVQSSQINKTIASRARKASAW